MYNIRLRAPKPAVESVRLNIGMPVVRTDGRKVGWSVYGHVIAEFSRTDRSGFELSP